MWFDVSPSPHDEGTGHIDFAWQRCFSIGLWAWLDGLLVRREVKRILNREVSHTDSQGSCGKWDIADAGGVGC